MRIKNKIKEEIAKKWKVGKVNGMSLRRIIKKKRINRDEEDSKG